MSELLSCPFCGGEARFETYGGTACAVVCQTCGCGTPTMRLDDGMIAADLWNRRAARTCRNVYEERVHPMDQCDNGFMCSECGNVVQDYEHYAITGVFNYCPNCGAKVVSDDADE